jgi:hypothetical protein
MGHEIPIFFLPVEPRERSWDRADAEKLIGEAYHDRERSRLCSSVSRNWWHLQNIRRSAAAHNSSSLEFLAATVACLDTSGIAKAIQALAAILAESSHGLERLATTCTPEANEAFLKMAADQGDGDAEPEELYLRAFLEATPSNDVKWSGDAGYSAGVGYFAFLKSLLLCLTECLIRGKHLLYYRPQP